MRIVRRFIPVIIGCGLGLLLTTAKSGPSWWPYAIVAIVFVGLLVLVGLSMLNGMPADVKLVPVEATRVLPGLQKLVDAAKELGFVQAGPPIEISVGRNTTIGMAHKTKPIYLALYQVGAVVVFDMASWFESDGGLTSTDSPAGGFAPHVPGSFKQVFPRASLADVLAHHERALAFVGERGVRVRPASPDKFADELVASMQRQRRAFLAHPARRVVLFLARMVTQRSPYRRPVADQAIARGELAAIGGSLGS